MNKRFSKRIIFMCGFLLLPFGLNFNFNDEIAALESPKTLGELDFISNKNTRDVQIAQIDGLLTEYGKQKDLENGFVRAFFLDEYVFIPLENVVSIDEQSGVIIFKV